MFGLSASQAPQLLFYQPRDCIKFVTSYPKAIKDNPVTRRLHDIRPLGPNIGI